MEKVEKQSAQKKRFSFFVILLLGILLVLGGVILHLIWLTDFPLNEESLFIVEKGSTVSKIASDLEDQGYIENRIFFRLLSLVSGYDNRLQAGTYVISKGMNSYDFLNSMVAGNALSTDITIRIVEGMNLDEMADVFEESELFSRDEFLSATTLQESHRIFWFLDHLNYGDSLLGYLFPDTYRFKPEWSADQVIMRILANTEQEFRTIGIHQQEVLDAGNFNLKDLIIFASIVQKESPKDDMNVIAGVFRNRLNNGWRFESDATVNFFLGTYNLIPSGRDIRINNPYNTYLYSGLPPGPIGNPGAEAIKASLEPAQHNYFFFLHTPDGVTILSKTFEEHLDNRAIYWE